MLPVCYALFLLFSIFHFITNFNNNGRGTLQRALQITISHNQQNPGTARRALTIIHLA